MLLGRIARPLPLPLYSIPSPPISSLPSADYLPVVLPDSKLAVCVSVYSGRTSSEAPKQTDLVDFFLQGWRSVLDTVLNFVAIAPEVQPG